MSKHTTFSSGDVFPSSFVNTQQEFISTLVANLRLSATATQITAVASTGSDQVGIGVGGLFRYTTSTQSITISGATGTYNLYAAASANSSNDSNWYLEFGTTAPTGTVNGNTRAATRKIGEVDWDTTAGAIIGLRQLTGSGDATAPITPTAPTATIPALVVRGAASHTANLLQVGSSASASDRLALTTNGQLQLPNTPSTATNGGLLLGGDALLYRSAADTLRTPDSLTVDGNVSLSGASGSIGFFGTAATTRKTGYGGGSQVGTKVALTSSSTLNDVIAVVSSLVADLRTHGLIGS